MENSSNKPKHFVNRKFLENIDENICDVCDFGYISNLRFSDSEFRELYHIPSLDSCLFESAIINDIFQRKGTIQFTKFISCTINDVVLSKGDLTNVHFENSSLTHVCFGGCYISNTTFKNCTYSEPLLNTEIGEQRPVEPILENVQIWDSIQKKYILADDWAHFLILIDNEKKIQ